MSLQLHTHHDHVRSTQNLTHQPPQIAYHRRKMPMTTTTSQEEKNTQHYAPRHERVQPIGQRTAHEGGNASPAHPCPRSRTWFASRRLMQRITNTRTSVNNPHTRRGWMWCTGKLHTCVQCIMIWNSVVLLSDGDDIVAKLLYHPHTRTSMSQQPPGRGEFVAGAHAPSPPLQSAPCMPIE